MSSVNKRFESSFRKHWNLVALVNYQGSSMTYGKLAENIGILHTAFRLSGLRQGDRVAICGKNQANWTVAFISALTGGYVPVPLLHEFKPETIQGLVAHSGAKFLFVDESILSSMDASGFEGVTTVNLRDMSSPVMERAMDEFARKYPFGFAPSEMDYHEDSPEELAMINYTSGTSGFSKGVMLPYRALEVNIDAAAYTAEPQMKAGDAMVSMLPCAHMYGLMFDTLFELTIGARTVYLTRSPSPKVVVGACRDVRPAVIMAVPLIMEKVYKSNVKPVLKKYGFFLKWPVVGAIMKKLICRNLVDSFGGGFEEVIMGGAAINPEVESFLKMVKFPFTCGYGMTECGPLVTYIKWRDVRLGSCGKPIPGVFVRIDSTDPQNIPGEVQISGKGVFLGYFDNPEATAASFTPDGWLKTGDMGVLDKDGFLYLRGRSKCMILGANGQNIYPEELEAVVNSFDGVLDSLVVEKDGALVALVYPDYKTSSAADIQALLPSVNRILPAYAQIRRIEVMADDFERTPKKSIKRYLYQQ